MELFLPKADLAANIIVAVLALVNHRAIKHTYAYPKSDCATMVAAILVTLAAGESLNKLMP